MKRDDICACVCARAVWGVEKETRRLRREVFNPKDPLM